MVDVCTDAYYYAVADITSRPAVVAAYLQAIYIYRYGVAKRVINQEAARAFDYRALPGMISNRREWSLAVDRCLDDRANEARSGLCLYIAFWVAKFPGDVFIGAS